MDRAAAAIAAYGGTKFSPDGPRAGKGGDGKGGGGARAAADRVSAELAAAARALFSDFPGADRAAVDAVLVATGDPSPYLAPILSEMIGVSPCIAHTVEGMCGSGTAAIVSAMAYVRSGMADLVLVVGGDLAGGPGSVLEWDASRGELAHPVYWASLFTAAYKRRYGATAEGLACVPAKAHLYAADNPLAYSRMRPTVPEAASSRPLTSDVRLHDCCRPCTGASAVLVASEDAARRTTDAPVWLAGAGQWTGPASLLASGDLARLETGAAAAADALAAAGAEPSDIDVAEVHDAFSVCEPMALECARLAAPGKGLDMCRNMLETGDRRVNPRGGLIGSGHPPAATGVAQAAEVAAQLQGRAGRRQADGARTGMVHNMSAAGTSSAVLVMRA